MTFIDLYIHPTLIVEILMDIIGRVKEQHLLKHLAQIRQALTISAGALVSGWRYAPRKKEL